MGKIKYATIGTSWITEAFIQAAQDEGSMELYAIYSRDTAKATNLANKWKAKKTYSNIEDLSKDQEIEAVYIASPNSLHYSQAIVLMRSAKHIISEKAIASNFREAMEMFDVAEKEGVILMEAMRSLYDPGVEAVKRNLQKIGMLRRIEFRFCQYSSRYNTFKSGKSCNIFSREFSAGALMDIGTYCIQPMIYLFGKPQSVIAKVVLLGDGIDGMGSIIADYGSMLAELSYSKISNNYLPSQLQGEDGVMHIQTITNPTSVKIRYNNGNEEAIYSSNIENNMIFEIKHFCKLIREKEKDDFGKEVSLSSMKLMDEVRRQTEVVFPAD